jgi:hypothetical protein
VSAYDVEVDVAIWVPERYILYPATPTLSVDAFHERLICDEDVADAVKFVGTEGAVVSATEDVNRKV